ncbi:MAG: tetratricopeptide repeat protein [Bacteroidota bacterium]|nr:tetratricopeptide repeat protein [Bacteroidota bacterium]
MQKIVVSLVFISLLFSACDTSKKLITEGNNYFLAGNFDDAANYYYNALLINPKNPEARQALKKSANNVLSAKFSTFGKYVVENNAEGAVKQYLSCQKYYQRVQSVGVELDWPNMYNEVYEDIKNEYISKQYDEGLKLMQANKYDKAELIFSNIASIDSGYINATVLRPHSIIEPLYQHGIKMQEAGNYKEAWRDFSKVISVDSTYKNTKKLLLETQKKASIEVGILAVQNQTHKEGFHQMLDQQIMASLLKSNNPFLKIIDSNAVKRMLNAQALSLSSIVDPASAAQAGKSIGLQFVLMTALGELRYEETDLHTDSVEAYLGFTETTPNKTTGLPQNVTRFKKVKYADTWQSRKVYYKVYYQLVSTQTAQVVANDVLTEEKNDENHICIFNGDINNLYPELPAGNFMPIATQSFREQFNAVKRNILTREELIREACIILSQKLVDDIRIYIEK